MNVIKKATICTFLYKQTFQIIKKWKSTFIIYRKFTNFPQKTLLNPNPTNHPRKRSKRPPTLTKPSNMNRTYGLFRHTSRWRVIWPPIHRSDWLFFHPKKVTSTNRGAGGRGFATRMRKRPSLLAVTRRRFFIVMMMIVMVVVAFCRFRVGYKWLLMCMVE